MDIDQDEARAAALPPPELTAFLRSIKLQKLDTQLEQLGYSTTTSTTQIYNIFTSFIVLL